MKHAALLCLLGFAACGEQAPAPGETKAAHTPRIHYFEISPM